MRGLAELRVKESDRLSATAAMLQAAGASVTIEGDDLLVHGAGRLAGGCAVETHMDHRLAMSALVMGLATDAPVTVDDAQLHRNQLPRLRRADARLGRGHPVIIAIDGPAAAGKGTLARRLAQELGLPYPGHGAAVSRCRPPRAGCRRRPGGCRHRRSAGARPPTGRPGKDGSTRPGGGPGGQPRRVHPRRACDAAGLPAQFQGRRRCWTGATSARWSSPTLR